MKRKLCFAKTEPLLQIDTILKKELKSYTLHSGALSGKTFDEKGLF